MIKIESVDFGEIKIDGKTYYSDLIIWWDGKIEFKEKFHIFDHNLFFEIAKRVPEIIVIGDGVMDKVKIDEDVWDLAERKNIELFVERSKKAAEMFNGFISDKRKAVIIIHC
jgi:hypothetical protein